MKKVKIIIKEKNNFPFIPLLNARPCNVFPSRDVLYTVNMCAYTGWMSII